MGKFIVNRPVTLYFTPWLRPFSCLARLKSFSFRPLSSAVAVCNILLMTG